MKIYSVSSSKAEIFSRGIYCKKHFFPFPGKYIPNSVTTED